MTAIVRLENVSKSFRPGVARRSLVKSLVTKSIKADDVLVLDKISLEIQSGECVGIFGPNGSGKSTLLKIIAGILGPSSGTMAIQGEVLPLLSWESCFVDDLEVRDNLFLFGAIAGLSTNAVARALSRIAAFAEIEGRLKDQMRTFSPGMKTKLALALANETSASVILLDETLSAGDARFRARCSEMLVQWKRQNRAIVHVSHDVTLMRTLSDRCYIFGGKTLHDFNIAELSDAALAMHTVWAKEA